MNILDMNFHDFNTQYYASLEKNNSHCQAVLHDFINHLSCLRGLVELGNKENLDSYFNTLAAEIHHVTYEPISGHKVLDVVLNDKRAKALDNQIEFEFYNDEVDLDFVNGPDLCVIFGNILDNAIDSCLKSADKTITIDLYQASTQDIVIKVVNSCWEEPQMKNGCFASSKQDAQHHGIGLKSVRQVAEKYGGQLVLHHDLENQSFISQITLHECANHLGLL